MNKEVKERNDERESRQTHPHLEYSILYHGIPIGLDNPFPLPSTLFLSSYVPYPQRHVNDASLISSSLSLSLSLLVHLNVPRPMSYDRVLPPLPAFRAPVVAASNTLGLHSLRRHRIMTHQSSNAIADRTRSLASQKRSPPAPAKGLASPDEESREDYEGSPMIRSRRSSQASNGESRQVKQRVPSVSKANAVSWQDESPSQICLCQPDPKVPRPRNGMSACDSSIYLSRTKKSRS